MSPQSLLANLGPEIEDPEEETFLIFSQSIPSQNLGFVDPRATSFEITVGGRDLIIHQSPTVLSSARDGGTTGAVVWKVTPLFAGWIASPSNLLFTYSALSSSSSVLELGCGISGLIALLLGPLVKQYTLTDQEYVKKCLTQNLLENCTSGTSRGRKSNVRTKKANTPGKGAASDKNISFKPLDWETDQVSSSLLDTGGVTGSFDTVIACDCIYNDALIEPFVQTCIDVCQLRNKEAEEPKAEPTLCIIAQQLRSAEVFEEWLKAFHRAFHVWRLSDNDLNSDLASNSGFVIHFGILR